MENNRKEQIEFFKAIEERNFQKIKTLLLEHEYTISIEYTLLAKYIDIGDLENLEFLLNAGFSADACEDYLFESILMYAARTGNLAAVKLLVNAGTNLMASAEDGDTAILRAAWNGKPDIVAYLSSFYSPEEVREAESLLVVGMRRQDKRARDFFHAINSSNYLEIQNAIASRIDVNTLSEEGYTALHIAAWRGDITTIEILLQAGANCEIRDELYGYGWTPLMRGASGAQYRAVEALINGSVNVNSCDFQGANSLMIAISHFPHYFDENCFDFRPKNMTLYEQLCKTTKILISAGIKIEHQDRLGNTALQLATEKHLRKLEFLLNSARLSQLL